jgi:hypothetical protein
MTGSDVVTNVGGMVRPEEQLVDHFLRTFFARVSPQLVVVKMRNDIVSQVLVVRYADALVPHQQPSYEKESIRLPGNDVVNTRFHELILR